MSKRRFTVVVLLLSVLIVYLFVQAPPPLDEANAREARTIPIEEAFAIVADENARVRALWTTDIVEAGLKRGLRFEENWRDEGVDAGPLPALFLRETAVSLEKDPIRLSLFLGSDAPVRPSNLFTGTQAERFREVRRLRKPVFFRAGDTGLNVAMFPDVAVAPGCVSCHNEHPETPKRDWQLNDVMGAVTWTYPRDSVSSEEVVAMVRALRKGIRAAYSGYLQETTTFARPPELGERWPREGYYLPTVDVFMAEVARRSSAATLERVMRATGNDGPR